MVVLTAPESSNLRYGKTQAEVRNALMQIYGMVEQRATLIAALLGRETPAALIVVWTLLVAETVGDVPAQYRPAAIRMGATGVLLVATALLYEFEKGLHYLPEQLREALRQRLDMSRAEVLELRDILGDKPSDNH